jgi:nicotinate-nucleotide adenylyltransferase
MNSNATEQDDMRYRQNRRPLHVALFGGSFDPPHIGHTAFCAELVRSETYDSIWVIPSIQHPFGKKMVSLQHRIQMCRIAFEPISPIIEIRNEEEQAGGTGYTIDLIRYLIATYHGCEFTLALGSDNYSTRHEWKDFEEIETLVSIRFFGRKGWNNENERLGLEASFPDVSSSELRNTLSTGHIPEQLLPPAVADYIRKNRLYINS